MSESKSITYRNLAGLSLSPINDRVQSLISWGPFDKYILEMVSINRDPRDILPGFNFQYRKLVPSIVLFSMAISGLMVESILVSTIPALLAFVLFVVRYRELVDRLQVIGRIPEIRNAIYRSVEYLHKENPVNPGYDTNFAQPLLVDYFKKRKTLTGKEFFNVYLELAQACGPLVSEIIVKKHEFAELFGIENLESQDSDSFGLEILSDENASDSELLNAVNQFKKDMEEQKLAKSTLPVNTKLCQNAPSDIKKSLAKVTAAIALVSATKNTEKQDVQENLANDKDEQLKEIIPIKASETANSNIEKTEKSSVENNIIKDPEPPIAILPPVNAGVKDMPNNENEVNIETHDDINPDLTEADIFDFDDDADYEIPNEDEDEYGIPDDDITLGDEDMDSLIDEFNNRED